MATQVAVGDIVDIEFYDHAEDADEAMRFKLCGEIAKITPISYVLYTWRYACPVARAKDSNTKENENRFAIVKKAIINIKKFE